MARNKEIGYTGLDEWKGHITEDFLRELRGKEGYKRYNEMRLNSPVIGAMLMAAEQAIRTVSWQYVSALGAEDPRVEFAQRALDGMTTSWEDHIIAALTMLPFGYAPFEIVYERRDNALMWRKFAIRGQDTVDHWLFDDTGGLQGLVQMGAPYFQYIEIPIEKMVLYRTRTEKNNPEGRSVLRTAWIPYYYAKNIMQIEAIGIERELAGLPVIEPPMGATTDESSSSSDVSKAAKIVRNLRNDEQAGLVLPPPTGDGKHQRWHFSLAATGGTRAIDTDLVIRRYESRMLMSALAQFLILGQDKVGAQALSSDMTDFWSNAINATADIISETHTEYALKRLLRLNGFDPEGIRMEHSPAGDIDIMALADALQKLGDKLTWLPTDEVWLRGAMKLPDASAEDIEAEKERRREMLPAFPPAPFGRPQPQDDDDEDEMGADMYAAGNAPDDAARLRYEENMKKVIKAYWEGEKKRVIQSAKRVKRGARI